MTDEIDAGVVCRGEGCPRADLCRRYMDAPFMAKPTYFAEAPVLADGSCPKFISTGLERKDPTRCGGAHPPPRCTWQCRIEEDVCGACGKCSRCLAEGPDCEAYADESSDVGVTEAVFHPPRYNMLITHQFEAIKTAIIAGDRESERAAFAGLGQLFASMLPSERWEHARSMGPKYKELSEAYALAAARDDAEPSPNEREILALAMKIGQHWRDQQGVNGGLLDQLAELTKPPGKDDDE
jgi:hypothetical protein